MSSEIGYGAAAIRAGETRYQEKIVELMKQAASRKPANDAEQTETKPAKPSDTSVGRNVDIKA